MQGRVKGKAKATTKKTKKSKDKEVPEDVVVANEQADSLFGMVYVLASNFNSHCKTGEPCYRAVCSRMGQRLW
jgi:hypothetical protein